MPEPEQYASNRHTMRDTSGDIHRAIPPAVWLTSRARNAMHRPVFIGAVAVGTFVAALVALVLAPQQVKRAAQAAAPSPIRPDTAGLAAAITQAQTRLSAAEASLQNARRSATAPQPAAEVAPAISPRRDTLSNAITELSSLLTRVETAPLTASYRALAESPQLIGNSRVKTLLDSLAEIERDREGFGATGGADPVFVALTSRATEIGRAIQAIAEERRDAMRKEVTRLATATRQITSAPPPAVDTAMWIAEVDSAKAQLSLATKSAADAGKKMQEYDKQVAQARDLANASAPPIALLASALIFGMMLGFGAALVDELKQPRVSDPHEVERVTGARVLATIRPLPPMPDRGRRLADQYAPPYFDPGAGGYQLAYLHVVRTGASRLMLTIAGEETSIAAVVAANLAAIAADEARSTIIVDTDTQTSPVAAALRIHAEPGIADILDGRVEWAEAVAPASVGRDRVIDVIPSGVAMKGRDPAEITDLFRREVARLSRYYEAIVIVTSPLQASSGLPGVLPIPDTILCARIGHTRLASLRKTIEAVRSAGGNPLGVMLWDAEPPAFPTPEQLARAPHPVRTTEMRALTTR
jgi:Mrp family chromosome partitioning ATPase